MVRILSGGFELIGPVGTQNSNTSNLFRAKPKIYRNLNDLHLKYVAAFSRADADG